MQQYKEKTTARSRSLPLSGSYSWRSEEQILKRTQSEMYQAATYHWQICRHQSHVIHRLKSTAVKIFLTIIDNNTNYELVRQVLYVWGFDNDGHKAWWPQRMTMMATNNDNDGHTPWWPHTMMATTMDGTGSFWEVGVMEFGLKGTSRLVADVTGSRHSGLGFTVFWLFTAV